MLDEFDKLFHSLYNEPEVYIKIIRAIASKKNGIARDKLIKSVREISNGGTLNIKLQSLEEAGFISTFLPLGHTRKGVHYRLIDEYSIFYLHWIEPMRKKTRITSLGNHWSSIMHSPAWHAWAGYAIELERKASIYKEKTRTKKQLIWCLISSNGVIKNEYFKKLIGSVIVVKDLF